MGVLVFQILFCVCGNGGDRPSSTVSFSSISAIKGLSGDNKYYTIKDEVQIEAPYYRFSVKAPHGEYEVVSIRDLLKVCYEIRVIEEFRATDQGDEAWNGAGESLKNIGRGAKRIVKEPKESAKAFKRAGEKLMRSVGRLFKKKDKGDAADGTDRDAGGEGFLVGTQARKFAAELGLDVYSDNPYVQALIQEVAKKRAKGSIATSVGLFFLSPVQGLGLLSNSLTPNGFDAETEKLICNEAPAELRYVLGENYKKELGLTSEKGSPVAILLDNINYSPREQAYLYYYFRTLSKPKEVSGLKSVLDVLGKVKSPDEATFVTNQMELVSAYQKYAQDLVNFVVTSDKVGCFTNKKQLLFILPYDIAEDTSVMQGFLGEIESAAKSNNAKSTQLWFTGDVSNGFVSKAKSAGVTIQKNVLQYPHFVSAGK
jgi:hypothetical protein